MLFYLERFPSPWMKTVLPRTLWKHEYKADTWGPGASYWWGQCMPINYGKELREDRPPCSLHIRVCFPTCRSSYYKNLEINRDPIIVVSSLINFSDFQSNGGGVLLGVTPSCFLPLLLGNGTESWHTIP